MFLYIVNNLLIMIFFLDHVYTSHLYFVHSQSYLLASGSLRKIRAKMYNTLWYFIKKLKMNLKKSLFSSIQFSHSVVSDSATAWTAARQTSLSITNSRSLPKLMSIESVMPSGHLILCCPLLLLPPVPPSIRVFSNESVLHISWPKYWSFSFSISPSSEYSGLISFRIDWLGLLAVQGTLEPSATQ